jgi:phosphoribosyl 1,2-cyclic phosphate phosphodiesterase
MQVTFLGTGTSHGIPVIGCNCPVCCSRDARDQRTRTSILIKTQGIKFLVDAAPELRLQMLAAREGHADALLLTHAHADHIAGLDDVRIFSERTCRNFPVYGPAGALREIRQRFDYVFRKTQAGGGKPHLSLFPVSKTFEIQNVRITPIPVWHGRLRVFGYRINDLAYLTDVSKIPESSYSLLKGLKVLVLDALREKPHATHFHLEKALAAARRINAVKTYFTHMCHALGHASTERKLPRNVRLAYDGLQLKLAE